MVQGPNDLPEIAKALPTRPAVPVAAAKPRPAAAPVRIFQAPDSVQISPRAAQASQLLSRALAEPDIRASRVEEVRAKLNATVKDSASLSAKLAEKLLTEN